MAVTKKEVEHIAGLARIKLTESEKEKMAEDMSQILGYIDKLNELDIKEAEATAQVTGLENIFRKDLPPHSLDECGGEPSMAAASARDNLINQFPHKKDDYLKVKSVFSAEGGPVSGGEEL